MWMYHFLNDGGQRIQRNMFHRIWAFSQEADDTRVVNHLKRPPPTDSHCLNWLACKEDVNIAVFLLDIHGVTWLLRQSKCDRRWKTCLLGGWGVVCLLEGGLSVSWGRVPGSPVRNCQPDRPILHFYSRFSFFNWRPFQTSEMWIW